MDQRACLRRQETLGHRQVARDHAGIGDQTPERDGGGQAGEDGKHREEGHACSDQAEMAVAHPQPDRHDEIPDLTQLPHARSILRKSLWCNLKRQARRGMVVANRRTPMTYIPRDDRYDRMIYNRCGRSGLKLPAISLGLWHNFGHDTPHATKAGDLPRGL